MALAICSDWIFQIYFSVISAARGGAVAKDVAAVFLIVVTQFVVKIINCNVLVHSSSALRSIQRLMNFTFENT